jgi:hypothetical protein
MRSLISGLFMLLCAPVFAQQQTPPIINFESVPNPLQLPQNMYFGEVSGIALNSKGHVFVLSRGNTTGPAYNATAAQVLEFDADGKFLREIGHNLYAWSFPHMLKIDPHDNVWVTDKGSDMVIKFNPEGRVAMVFGRKQEASDEETGPLKHPKPTLPITPSSATATSIRESPRSTRTATGSNPGANAAAAPASSTPHTRSRPTPRATSMSPTAAITASRCSTTTEISCAKS